MRSSVRLAVSAGLAAAVQSASAADLPKPIRAPAHAPYSWTGLYIGGHVGHGWGEMDWSLPDPNTAFFGDPPDHSPSGLLAGGQIGVNYQTGPWVFGVEGQVSWADLEDKSTQVFPKFTTADFRSRVEYLGSLTARLGYTIQPTVLLYLKGGVAFDGPRLDGTLTIANQTSAIATLEQDRIGWTIGGGVERALAGPWSLKIEYQYMDFGSNTDTATITVPGEGSTTVPVNLDQDIHVVKVGINYRFDY